MGVLDSVMTETGSELGISTNSSRSVMSSLLTFINQEDGGFSGFLDRFRRAGSGTAVSSWLSGDTKPVSPDTVENALGHSTIERIGNRAGLSFSTAASAIALMIPKLTRFLAPGGAIPRTLSPDIRSYISAPAASAGNAVNYAGGAAANAAGATVARTRGAGRFVWPLLLLLGGILLVIWLINRAPSAGNVPTSGAFNAADQARQSSARATAALKALRPGVNPRELTNALNLMVINFAPGSADIPSESRDTLNAAATAIQKAQPNTVIEIGGHTDGTGDASANMQLSQERAESVRTYLVQHGVNASSLTAVGYGDTQPLNGNTTEAERFKNRRIEFKVK